MLRPFVYRRYLDFGVFDSLRAMKELIAREVERRELKDNVKLGPGRHPRDRVHRAGIPADPRRQRSAAADPQSARRAVAACRSEAAAGRGGRRAAERRIVTCAASRTACSSGTTSRRTSCRRTTAGRARLARDHGRRGLGGASRPSCVRHRDRVSTHFRTLVFGPAQTEAGNGCRARRSSACSSPSSTICVARALLRDTGVLGRRAGARRASTQLRESAYLRRLDATGRRRLTTLLPKLLQRIAGRDSESTALNRVLHVLERIGGRTVYLALLNENALALATPGRSLRAVRVSRRPDCGLPAAAR